MHDAGLRCFPGGARLSSRMVLIACALLLAPLGSVSFPSPASGSNYLINPTTKTEWVNGDVWIDFNIASGEVVRKSGNLKIQGEELAIDTWVNYHCDDGDDLVLVNFAVGNPRKWGERRNSFNGELSTNKSHLRREAYYGVPFTTKSALRTACRAGTGAVDEIYSMAVMCIDILKDPRLDTKRVTARLNCIDERPSTVVERVKLSCPTGYWVEHTTKQEFTFEFDPAHPPVLNNMCVPQGTIGDKACPFIFTQESEGGTWLAQGTILTYHNGKKTERTQVKDLTAFAGKVLIREIDPETSFTDSLSVILFYPDGRKTVLAPEREELRAIDGRYLVTDQGDEVEVSFERPGDWAFERAEITAHGYYEPY